MIRLSPSMLLVVRYGPDTLIAAVGAENCLLLLLLPLLLGVWEAVVAASCAALTASCCSSCCDWVGGSCAEGLGIVVLAVLLLLVLGCSRAAVLQAVGGLAGRSTVPCPSLQHVSTSTTHRVMSAYGSPKPA
jgi:hypothetical protein